MLEKIKRRWKAESTAFGKFMAKVPPIIVALSAIINESLVEMDRLPQGLVPDWAKSTLAVVAFLCWLYGKLTVSLEKSN